MSELERVLLDALVRLGHGTETASRRCPAYGYEGGAACPGCYAVELGRKYEEAK